VIAALDRRLVAVMFTDMAGYTDLLHADERLAVDRRERYWSALERHHAAFGGTIVQRLGDGSMSMFPTSLAAVQAAVAVQQELRPQDVLVRIGVHTGEVVVERERLTGDAVNVAARIESFAVPGGALLSDAAYEQIENRRDVVAVALGRFRLKNVGRPFELYALSADGLVVPDAGALEGKGERFGSFPCNLPTPSAPLVGRNDELATLTDLLRSHRVVTITGPGGVGKTRVLIELGRLLAAEFPDALAFVPLADVADPVAFLPALATALDVKEAVDRALVDGVASLIGDRAALLLLDNFEQIASVAPELGLLIERCPSLRIAVTSRAPLRIAAEHEFPLGPLALPSLSDATSAESVTASPAVALFVQRARTARGSFDLTPENAGAIAAICRRLDGLPLALELAAARVRLLSPSALLERLDHALDVLTSARRDSPRRQQTLRATIDWSHSLLTEPEQRLFRRMAVFAGGCRLDDVEAVCGDAQTPALDGLESLVDEALLLTGGDERLQMLETIREYARERLEAAGEAGDIAQRHAHRYAALAREIRDGIEGTTQRTSIERGVAEEANLEAALSTLLSAARDGDATALEAGLQLCGDLWMYWHIRGRHLTARDQVAAFFDADAAGEPTVGRAGALIAAGLASWTLGAYERANEQWAEAYRLATELDATREVCIGAICRAIGLLGMDLAAASRWTREATERSGTVGFAWAEGLAWTFEGIVEALTGKADAAVGASERALGLQRGLGDHEGAGLSLGSLAQLAAGRGDLVAALDLYAQALSAFEAIGDRAEEARILSEMAWIHLRSGDAAAGRGYFFDSVQAYRELASIRGVGLSLIGLAAAAAVEHHPETAARIAAAAEIYAREEGIVNVYADNPFGRELIERECASLSPDDVTRATEAGRRLTVAEALELARPAASAPPS
jgi:predicted ATPase/class 3 adenylate cyclase